jgi:hypothetical protein
VSRVDAVPEPALGEIAGRRLDTLLQKQKDLTRAVPARDRARVPISPGWSR